MKNRERIRELETRVGALEDAVLRLSGGVPVARDGYGDNWRPAVETCGEPGPFNQRCGLTPKGHAGRHIGTDGTVWLNAEDAHDIELYGPHGARWGNPNKPCPFVGLTGPCTLGLNHSRRHIDGNGNAMEFAINVTDEILSEATGMVGTMFVVDYAPGHEHDPFRTRVKPDDACTCGNPAEHQPGCPRYARASGTPEGGRET